MDNSMLQALADYIKVKPSTPFKLQRQNGVTEYADYEFEEPKEKKSGLTEKERNVVIKAREFYDAYVTHLRDETDSLTSGMKNMNVDVDIQPWILDMPTNHLQATIRELAEDMNASLTSTFSSKEIVTEDNRNLYEYNLALFLTNAQRQYDMDAL